jgi:DNA (cytosine-5)-methyltransferase 1
VIAAWDRLARRVRQNTFHKDRSDFCVSAYYNEFNPRAAQRLRDLIARGHIASGEVDTRSITEVQPDDLKGFTQCHFFAGIGGWSLALRYAGWSDHRPVWTASCPCQPFSTASVAHGGAKGQGDHRDLWPVFAPLAAKWRPAAIFGEQVSQAIQWGWWDRAALDLEAMSYAVAAAVLRADAYQGRHERKRLYWMADAGGARWQGSEPDNGLPFTTEAAFAEYGDTVARAGRALDGCFADLLPRDGVSVTMERAALHGYGNALHVGSAFAFIKAAAEAVSETT